MTDFSVALVGNPNAGKSTVFNALTGLKQHVGNWPGKTVECKRGAFRHRGLDVEVIDLPGTYSLSAYSEEEVIARDFLLMDEPDIVVAVVDAANLERNLYLVVQVLELQLHMIVALNMIDRARAKGYDICEDRLSEYLGGAAVVPMSAIRKEGIEALKDAIIDLALAQAKPGVQERVAS